MKPPYTLTTSLLLACTCFIATLTPVVLATRFIPLGEGLDEFSHFDYIFYRFLHPTREIRSVEGLYQPGVAPLGQGHQAPLYYHLGQLLHLPLDRKEVGAFIDYQSGVQYSSEGITLGGLDHCPYREDPRRTDPETLHFRNTLKGLRVISGFFAGVVILLAFSAGRSLFIGNDRLALSLALLVGANPTGIWRGAFVNNDNLVALFAGATFTYGMSLLRKGYAICGRDAMILGALSALAFLSKYNGVMAFGLAFGAVILAPSSYATWREWIIRRGSLSLITASTILLITLPTLLRNYAVDGDPLSQQATITVTWFLYRPSSFWAILTDPLFIKIALSRFWVEYHSVAIPDPNFPTVIPVAWHWIGAMATIGIGLWVLRNIRGGEWRGSRAFLYSFLGAATALVVLIQLGATFPMPGGRYLHTALIPGSALALFGIYHLFHFFPATRRVADRLTLGMSLIGFLSLQSYTFLYLSERYGDCRAKTSFNVDSGGEFVPLELNGTPGDELAFFHRNRNRTFFAANGSTGFRLEPDWTRAVGLLGDEVRTGDTDGDGIEEMIYWRPAVGLWNIVESSSITSYDKSVAPYRDSSMKYETFHWPAKRGDTPFVGDLSGGPEEELVIFRPEQAEWHVFERAKNESTRWRKVGKAKFGPRRRTPLLISLTGKKHLGTFTPSTGVLRAGTFPEGSGVLQITLEHGDDLLPLDINRDGTDELLLWRMDTSCASLFSLGEDLTQVAKREVCFERDGIPLNRDRHRTLRSIALSERLSGVAVFDKIDGTVTTFAIEQVAADSARLLLTGTVFDPGWSKGMGIRR